MIRNEFIKAYEDFKKVYFDKSELNRIKKYADYIGNGIFKVKGNNTNNPLFKTKIRTNELEEKYNSPLLYSKDYYVKVINKNPLIIQVKNDAHYKDCVIVFIKEHGITEEELKVVQKDIDFNFSATIEKLTDMKTRSIIEQVKNGAYTKEQIENKSLKWAVSGRCIDVNSPKYNQVITKAYNHEIRGRDMKDLEDPITVQMNMPVKTSVQIDIDIEI